jgi:hypothetical protein
VPSGLATDNSTKGFFGDLISKKSLDSFFEFENEGFFSGAGQGHMLRFALTTIVGFAMQIQETRFLFQAKKLDHLHDSERVFTLSAEDIERVNPNTLTCPIFQSRYDAELTTRIYQKIPVLVRESRGDFPEVNPWGVSFMAMFHMSNDSHLFKRHEELVDDGFGLLGNHFLRDGEDFFTLYESKMIQLYNHRHGDFADSKYERVHILPKISEEKLRNPNYVTTPCYWVSKEDVEAKCRSTSWDKNWFFAWRRITDARASARTVIASIIPRSGAGDSLFIPILKEFADRRLYACFMANMGTLVFDYVARQKLGGLNLNYFTFKQLPFLNPVAYVDSDIEFISSRIAELTYTAVDVSGWANDISKATSPFEFNLSRRSILQSEVDAYYAKLYGLSRNELQFILEPKSIKPGYPSETFSVLKRNEEREFGEYRTQRLVLEAWDKLQSGELH